MKAIVAYPLILLVLVIAPKYSNADNNHAERPERTSTNIVPAKPILRGPPKYPFRARKLAIDGLVELSMIVTPEGEVQSVVTVRSSDEMFEKAAISAAQKYEFEPAKRNGLAVASHAQIRVVFQMQDTKNAVTKYFYKTINLADKELRRETPNLEKVKERIERLKRESDLSHYAYARLSLVEYMYHNARGDYDAQIESIRLTKMYESFTSEQGRFIEGNVIEQLDV
ncbi:MAG: energy transducer TonB, partial [Pseudomonadota bacterium]